MSLRHDERGEKHQQTKEKFCFAVRRKEIVAGRVQRSFCYVNRV